MILSLQFPRVQTQFFCALNWLIGFQTAFASWKNPSYIPLTSVLCEKIAAELCYSFSVAAAHAEKSNHL